MGLRSGHGTSVVIREVSLYPQSLLAKLTVLLFVHRKGLAGREGKGAGGRIYSIV